MAHDSNSYWNKSFIEASMMGFIKVLCFRIIKLQKIYLSNVHYSLYVKSSDINCFLCLLSQRSSEILDHIQSFPVEVTRSFISKFLFIVFAFGCSGIYININIWNVPVLLMVKKVVEWMWTTYLFLKFHFFLILPMSEYLFRKLLFVTSISRILLYILPKRCAIANRFLIFQNYIWILF